MNANFALVLHELRNARASLLAAAGLTLLVLAILHTFASTPTESAAAIAFMWSLCALQFACDSFATDLASGRLRTRSALPVSARMLWGAKLAAFVASVVLLAAFGVAVELAWQAGCGRAGACSEFVNALPPVTYILPLLALIGATGMLCSLMVESALTAMLLSGLVLGGLWGLALAFEESTRLTGEDLISRHPMSAALLCAVVFFAIGQIAFARAQRRLGDGAVRLRAVLVAALLCSIGLAGTAAAASWHWATHGLEDGHLQIFPSIASPDGRFVAFMAAQQRRGFNSRSASQRQLTSVWVIDLETSERHLIAAPGQFASDWYTRRHREWSEAEGLVVFTESSWNFGGDTGALRLRTVDGRLGVEPLADPKQAIGGRLPEWAAVTEQRVKNACGKATTVQWKGTEFERKFEGEFSSTHIGIGIVLSQRPGCILALREKQLRFIDMSSGQERVLLEDCEGSLAASPDSLAVLACTETGVHVFSTDDGSPLHTPWLRKEWAVKWIEGDDQSHELLLRRRGTNSISRILDVANGCEVELEGMGLRCLARIRDRGYTDVDAHGDLVWLNRAGRTVKVLVDR